MRKLKYLLSIGMLVGVSSVTTAFANEDHQGIQGPFPTPMDVTKKCLECHDNAAHDIMQTSHWTWELEQDVAGQGNVFRGKKNAINNFCISINGNWPRCTSCHISYGWKDGNFDFSDESRVDCLVCHDTTGTYKKPGPAAGIFVKRNFNNRLSLRGGLSFARVAASDANSTNNFEKNRLYCGMISRESESCAARIMPNNKGKCM